MLTRQNRQSKEGRGFNANAMDAVSVEMLGRVVVWVVQLFMVFGGILPYLPQYLTVYRSRDAHGFSTLVCFVIIMSQILRILFW